MEQREIGTVCCGKGSDFIGTYPMKWFNVVAESFRFHRQIGKICGMSFSCTTVDKLQFEPLLNISLPSQIFS